MVDYCFGKQRCCYSGFLVKTSIVVQNHDKELDGEQQRVLQVATGVAGWEFTLSLPKGCKSSPQGLCTGGFSCGLSAAIWAKGEWRRGNGLEVLLKRMYT